jgi:hypothetical protein
MKWHPAVAAQGRQEPRQQEQEEQVLRVDQVATRLRLSTRRVRQLCQDNLLPGAVKISERKWLIPEGAIADYLKFINQEKGGEEMQ